MNEHPEAQLLILYNYMKFLLSLASKYNMSRTPNSLKQATVRLTPPPYTHTHTHRLTRLTSVFSFFHKHLLRTNEPGRDDLALYWTKRNNPQNVKWHHKLIRQYINPHKKRSATDILRDFEKSSWITSAWKPDLKEQNGLKGGWCCIVHFITLKLC